MNNSRLGFSILTIVLVICARSTNTVHAQGPTEIRGSFVLVGPAQKHVATSRGGRQLSVNRGELKVQDIKFQTQEVNFRGSKVKLDSAEVRKALEDSIRSLTATLAIPQNESPKLTAAVERPADVGMKSKAKVAGPITFDYEGAGHMPLIVIDAANKQAQGAASSRAAGKVGTSGKSAEIQKLPASAAIQKVALRAGKAEWEGDVKNFKSNVRGLSAFNGATIHVSTVSEISEVDLAGIARSRVNFLVRVNQ